MRYSRERRFYFCPRGGLLETAFVIRALHCSTTLLIVWLVPHVRLEPIYLANVLLFVDDAETVAAFPLVSKSCREATLTLKVNPAAFSGSPRAILWRFPNNTMVVNDLACLETSEPLPSTVTSVVVGSVDFKLLTDEQLRFADRVVNPATERATAGQTPTSPSSRRRHGSRRPTC